MRHRLACLLILLLSAVCSVQAAKPDSDAAQKLMQQGNWKEAYEAYEKILTGDDYTPGNQAAQDYNNAINCLNRLGNLKDLDAFREAVVAAHSDDWRLIHAVAQSYLGQAHHGYMIAGEWERGNHRGGGEVMNASERDRVRALQLYESTLPLLQEDSRKADASSAMLRIAQTILSGRGHNESWRLTYLTDLTELPDYEPGWGYYRGAGVTGAPVDGQGDPVFHAVPASWAAATTDGERWRWLLMMAVELHPRNAGSVQYQYATFLMQQFGVQTLASYGYGRYWGQADSDDGDAQRGILTLHTLTDDETVARLAGGVKRFEMPAESNYIAILTALSTDKQSGYGDAALRQLAQIYLNRRQYDKAADMWRLNIKLYGDNSRHKPKQKALDQIVEPWARFEPSGPQPPRADGATVPFRYRNAKTASFTARQVKVEQLLGDVQAYLKTNPMEVDWQTINVHDLGRRLLEANQSRYLDTTKIEWTRALQPRPKHFDALIQLETPLKTAGVYWLEAEMEDGNRVRTLIWIQDTVIVEKPLDKGSYYYVADATTGAPIAGMSLEFFGYRQEYINNAKRGERRYNVFTNDFAKTTDDLGQLILPQDEESRRYNYLLIAKGADGRYDYMGWQNLWTGHWYDQQYNSNKIYGITDRPVYRPDQEVKFKFWLNHAKYDQEGQSPFAGTKIPVWIHDPSGEEVFHAILTADEYGGIDASFTLAADAKLGVYSISLRHHGGSATFRVEEYKKPEYEVTIDAPTKPVALGEKIEATIKATYLFGAPVTEATVKYKVTRTSHDSRWYPYSPWDWLYGSGYWWYGYDYAWYPGWERWGCIAPTPWWWPSRNEQPEVVAEVEAEIGPDGTLTVPIDTLLAKELHGNQDHAYSITAEVVDQSRRTIVGTGRVLVAREPFKVYTWLDRGHYRVGDTIQAHFNAKTLDDKPVDGEAKITLFKVTYDENDQPVETAAQTWAERMGDDGLLDLKLSASEAGQYRLAATVTDSEGHSIEGGYVFVVAGTGFDGREYRFNAVELVPDRKEYAPGETVKMRINTAAEGSTVLLFERPSNGNYLKPRVLKLEGKSLEAELAIIKKDMPNIFLEALTIADGKVHTEVREIIVPPESRVLDVEVIPSQEEYLPGAEATVKVKLTDATGEPFVGSTVMTIYDRAVEYISGGSNVGDIKDFFWNWRRRHTTNQRHNLQRWFQSYYLNGEQRMSNLGVFGQDVTSMADDSLAMGGEGAVMESRQAMRRGGPPAPAAPMAFAKSAGAPMEAAEAELSMADSASDMDMGAAAPGGGGGGGGGAATVAPTVRQNFADTAFWTGSLTTDKTGVAEVKLTMPENLTSWKIRTWAMGAGSRVGESTVTVVTKKNVIIRLQAPRFFVQTDEVVLSAVVHNYLKTDKQVTVKLELDGGQLVPLPETVTTQQVTIEAGGETRVDWRVKAVTEGEVTIRMLALTDEESDAMQMTFPVKVHGMDKMVAWSGHMPVALQQMEFGFEVPADRKVETGRMELRYSPTLAGAMVDALPYMVRYPYGCTEQTLNRFLPTVITQKVLLDMGLELADIRDKRSNLNAQEIGDDTERAEQWKRTNPHRIVRYDADGKAIYIDNPVFDDATVRDMVNVGVERLLAMQLRDGGWGWFSGMHERSYPHTTAYVVHGLQTARWNDAAVPDDAIAQGIAWLKRYQDEQVRLLKNGDREDRPDGMRYKRSADNLDAFVYMVLIDADVAHPDMLDYLYRDRNNLSVYAKCMYGIALHKQKQVEKRDMVRRNIEQFLKTDAENQTAWLELGNNSYWYYWYGSEWEAHAYYLKFLSAVDPQGQTAPWLVKYLLNNRKNATYWNSTRDTALCIEAFADYMRASGEDKPDMSVEILVDGKVEKTVRITADNLFNFDNKLVITGEDLTSGSHTVEIRKTGKGPLYLNNYVSYFSLEDHIEKAGLEVKVERKVYKLIPVEKTEKSATASGQAVDQKVEKYERQEVSNLDTLTSGDLVEVELVIESKNDYEYILFEDYKAAGFEAVDLQSGYSRNGLGAYMELRDDRVCFFVRALARGRHSINYRLRAEIPGKFSALPATAYAMYAPELRGNSDEIKLNIVDKH